MRKKIALLAALAVLSAALLACNKKEQANEIVIGEYGSMTGATATFGQSTHKGITMAFDNPARRSFVVEMAAPPSDFAPESAAATARTEIAATCVFLFMSCLHFWATDL